MGADKASNDVGAKKVEKGQCTQGKEEAMNGDKLPLLAAYSDENLSAEGAEQLVRMS